MFRKSLFAAIALILSLAFAPAAHAAQSKLNGNTITSNAFPVGTITIDPAFKYIGSTEFILYNVATCEIHVYAELDDKQVKRLYWVQFEGYLPDTRHTYNYSSDPKRATLGGHAFHERASFRDIEASRPKMRPGSDSAAVLKLFDDKGFRVGPDMAQLRLVRLDDAARKELMIIYAEDLSPTGLKAADLAEGGKAFGQRETLIDGLRQRAVQGIRMEMK